MKKAPIHIQDTLTVGTGLELSLSKEVDVDAEQLGDALRLLACINAYSGDDAGCDWFYCEERDIIFIDNPAWVVSKDQKLIQIMKTADLLTGSDFSAKGNGFSMPEEDCIECGGYGRVCTDPDSIDEEETCEACHGSGAMKGSKAYEEHCNR